MTEQAFTIGPHFYSKHEMQQEYRQMPDGIACFGRTKITAPDGAVTYTDWQDLGSRIKNCSMEQFRRYQAGDFSPETSGLLARLLAFFTE